MFEYLEPAKGIVVPGLDEFEFVYAKNQPQYNPLRTIKANNPGGSVLSRWTLTDAQREAVANGADIFLELLTFGGPLAPCLLAVGEPDVEYFAERYNLKPETKNV